MSNSSNQEKTQIRKLREDMTERAQAFNRDYTAIGRQLQQKATQWGDLINGVINGPVKDLALYTSRVQNGMEEAAFKVAKFSRDVYSLVHPALEMLRNIDFNEIFENMKGNLKELDESLEVYDKLLWAIDDDLFEAITVGECNADTISEYIECNLNVYEEFFLNEEYYSKYHTLLGQAIFAIRNEQYAIAVMPLFAIIDGLLTAAFEGYAIAEERLTPKLKKNNNQNKVFFKAQDYATNDEDKLIYYLIYFRRVFNVYSIFFKPYGKNKYPNEINRNFVMHGSYKYNEITKDDVLKLLQLVKASHILQYITFK